MVIVAVVGGTGSVGKTIVDALKEDGHHEVIVIGRKVPDGNNPVPTFAVDYNDVDQITRVLDANKVHTIISTIALYDPVSAQSERNLIAGAAKSTTVKRFVQSHWGDKHPEDESLRIPPHDFRDLSIAALRNTSLEWTSIHNGLFADYFGVPHVPTYLSPLVLFVDIAHRTAAIPEGAGDKKITLTYTKDLAKFVVAAVGLERWDEVMHCYSDHATMNEIVGWAEEATGDTFSVVYDSAEKLRSGEITELPSHPYMYQYFPKPLLVGLLSKFGLWAQAGIMSRPTSGAMNEKFPEIKTTSVKEVVNAWNGH